VPVVKKLTYYVTKVGQNHTFIGIYGIFGRDTTIHTVIYGVCMYGSGQPYYLVIASRGHNPHATSSN
jgi:hypothetical protein